MSNSISDNLQRLQTARTAIANKITELGGTVGSSDGFEEFPNDMDSIPTGSSAYAFLLVTTEEGTTVTVSKGQITLDTKTSISGEELLFEIPESGTWTVEADNDVSTTVTISDQSIYSADLIPVYGVSWDKSATSILTRTDASANFSDPVAYMNDGSHPGSSPFDNIMPWSGMTKVVVGDNTWVRIPKFYYKITNTENELKFQISSKPKEGFSVSPAHMNRNDGYGEKDYVYIGRYKYGSKYVSSSYKYYDSNPTTNIYTTSNGTKFSYDISSIGNNGNKRLSDFTMFWTIRMLYLVEFANWDSQSVIGMGVGQYQNFTQGYTDSMPYHTGTMLSSRATNNAGIQYRWIEGLWDCLYEYCGGICWYNSTIYVNLQGGSTSESGLGKSIGAAYQLSDYDGIKSYYVPNLISYDWALYPNSMGSGYIPDGCNMITGESYNVAIVATGGKYSPYYYNYYGMFYINMNYVNASATASSSYRLAYRKMCLETPT